MGEWSYKCAGLILYVCVGEGELSKKERNMTIQFNIHVFDPAHPRNLDDEIDKKKYMVDHK